jgi:GTP-binding protein
MKKIAFRTARFLGSMLDEVFRDLSGNPLSEIALVGRSNVGKSSLINHLLRHKGLAHVSSKPGKTITLNYYNVDDALILVDLPGYGYAKRAKEDQASWSEVVDRYLNERKTLKLVLLLVDSRRELSEEDLSIAEWAAHAQKPLLLIFTKSDTIKLHEKRVDGARQMYYSIKDGKSRDVLISKINQVLEC